MQALENKSRRTRLLVLNACFMTSRAGARVADGEESRTRLHLCAPATRAHVH